MDQIFCFPITLLGGILPQFNVFIFDLGAGISCWGRRTVFRSGNELNSLLTFRYAGWPIEANRFEGTGGGGTTPLTENMAGGGGTGGGGGGTMGPPLPDMRAGGGGGGGTGDELFDLFISDCEEKAGGGGGGGGGDKAAALEGGSGDKGPEPLLEDMEEGLRLGLVASLRQCGHANFWTLEVRSRRTESSWLSSNVAR